VEEGAKVDRRWTEKGLCVSPLSPDPLNLSLHFSCLFKIGCLSDSFVQVLSQRWIDIDVDVDILSIAILLNV
jgi:hypothetical protein